MKLRNIKNKSFHNDLNFSLKREVLFVIVGAVIGAITMILPRTIYEFITD